MFKTFINAFKIKELRVKILLTLLLLFIFRLGAWLPIPGIDTEAFGAAVGEEGRDFIQLLSAISGGALANGSFLALGVSPYITASIVVQLITVAFPKLEKWSKQGEEGTRKLNFVTRIAALVLSVIQAIGIVLTFQSNLDINLGIPSWMALTFIAIVLIAGGMFTVWLGERITELGVGNGMSLLIFVGIISSAGSAIFQSFQQVFNGDLEFLWTLLIFALAIIFVFAFIVFIDLSERKIPVQYAKQIKGRKMYGGQSTHIPIKVNASGVMPIIFANALLTFPQMILSIFWSNTDAYLWYQEHMGAGSWVYIILTAILILFFSYFYSQITFNPEDVSKRIQQNGGFIPGIRAGKPTTEYLQKIVSRITLFGAIFLGFIALLPSLAMKSISSALSTQQLITAFSATGLMIIVSVALELDKQLDAQMLMRNYKGFLK